jgi:hypothetical protein
MATAERRANPADLVKELLDRMQIEHAKLCESYATIAECAEQLRRVTLDTERKLIGRS